MANTQSKIDSLEEQISKLIAENTELKRENAEFSAKEEGFRARIVELERNAKESAENEERSQIENSKLKGRVTKLERDIKEIKQKQITPNISELHTDISISSHSVTFSGNLEDKMVEKVKSLPDTKTKLSISTESHVSDSS
ncbi:286_t:CDS:2, partial [Racocetra persica]